MLLPLVPQCIMAADRTVPPLGSGRVGNRHRLLAVGSLGTHQMGLGTGVHIMAAQAGDGVLFTGMQIVEIAGSVTEAVLLRFLLRHQGAVMTRKTELLHRSTKLELEIGGVRCMAAETIVFLDRRVHTRLFGLVIVALVTDLGTLVLDPEQAVIDLMVARCDTVTGGTLLVSQTAVNEGGGHFAGVALVAGFPAYGINSSFGFGSRNVCMVIQPNNECQSESNT